MYILIHLRCSTDKLGFDVGRLFIVLDLDDDVWPCRQRDHAAHGGDTCAGVAYVDAAAQALHDNPSCPGADVVVVVSLDAS
jgi:hypothetical protein